MREHKYRVWDKSDCRMLNDVTGFVQDLNKKKTRVFKMDADCVDGMSSGLFNSADIEIIQYTGLKDKNGVEIYEGDIVFDDVSAIYTIEYCIEYCAYGLIGSDGDVEPVDDGSLEHYEVIGNIHEEKK